MNAQITEQIKDSNEISIVVQEFNDRQALINILAHHQYEVTVRQVHDGMGSEPIWYIVQAHKVC